MALQVTVVWLGQPDRPDPRERLDSLAFRVQLVLPETREIRGRVVRKDSLGSEVLPVTRESAASRDNLGRKVERASRDLPASRALRALLVNQAGSDLLASRVTRASLETPGFLAVREILDLPVKVVLSDLRDFPVLPDSLDQLVAEA